MSRTIFFLASVALTALGVATVAAFLGPWSQFADAFSHFRLHMSAFALLSAALAIASGGLARARKAAVIGLLIAIINTMTSLGVSEVAEAAPAGGTPLKVMTINVLYRAANDEQIVAHITAEQPDVVLLQELTQARAGLLDRLHAAYPWQVHCGSAAPTGEQWSCDVAIVSRVPWESARADAIGDEGAKLATARFGAAHEGLLVGSIHLKWPLISDQAAQLRAIANEIAGHRGPIVLAGDLNAAPWSAAVRAFIRQSNLREASRFTPTWPRRTFVGGRPCALCVPQLQIDHVFVSAHVRVVGAHAGDDVGSDHLPLIAELALPLRFVASDAVR